MNIRLPLCLMSLLVALPLALAGCGNSGPLVMPDAAPASDIDDGDKVDSTNPSEVETPVADPIPDIDLDDDDGNG